jgi:hypothetical protein
MNANEDHPFGAIRVSVLARIVAAVSAHDAKNSFERHERSVGK